MEPSYTYRQISTDRMGMAYRVHEEPVFCSCLCIEKETGSSVGLSQEVVG